MDPGPAAWWLLFIIALMERGVRVGRKAWILLSKKISFENQKSERLSFQLIKQCRKKRQVRVGKYILTFLALQKKWMCWIYSPKGRKLVSYSPHGKCTLLSCLIRTGTATRKQKLVQLSGEEPPGPPLACERFLRISKEHILYIWVESQGHHQWGCCVWGSGW